jgi:ATP-dependent HslUV protease ATP-binding subunit HslU
VELEREEERGRSAEELTPREIVAQLDRYVVGQQAAKKAVAVALRNRVRRQRLAPGMREEVVPKNIILIGPTGIGKTEIARRLARLTHSPFLKVEASKYTEVGYVGRDAESMVRDLTDVAVKMVREEFARKVAPKAREAAEERLLQLLLPRPNRVDFLEGREQDREEALRATREKLREQLRRGSLEGRRVEVEVQERAFPALQIFTPAGMEEMDINLREILPGLFGGRPRRKKVRVAEARELLMREEEQRLVDMDAVTRAAIERVEQSGIVFLDEIDKIAGREAPVRGPDVSREGVQRDLLPIIEGTTVNTKYGMVRTDHILFIAAGAFHVAKPSDLIPELQGRFPIRVELEPLTKADFVRILREPQNALTKQYTALMATEGVDLQFSDQAIELIAEYAALANERAENIGARRLHTVMERLLEELSFAAPEAPEKSVRIDADYVRRRLASVVKDPDLSRYIL